MSNSSGNGARDIDGEPQTIWKSSVGSCMEDGQFLLSYILKVFSTTTLFPVVKILLVAGWRNLGAWSVPFDVLRSLYRFNHSDANSRSSAFSDTKKTWSFFHSSPS